MRVRMITHVAGPVWSASAGTVVDISDSEARELMAGHYAEAAGPAPAPEVATVVAPERMTAGPPETATVKAPETAARPRPRARKG